jgi:hypothetical protein
MKFCTMRNLTISILPIKRIVRFCFVPWLQGIAKPNQSIIKAMLLTLGLNVSLFYLSLGLRLFF